MFIFSTDACFCNLTQFMFLERYVFTTQNPRRFSILIQFDQFNKYIYFISSFLHIIIFLCFNKLIYIYWKGLWYSRKASETSNSTEYRWNTSTSIIYITSSRFIEFEKNICIYNTIYNIIYTIFIGITFLILWQFCISWKIFRMLF